MMDVIARRKRQPRQLTDREGWTACLRVKKPGMEGRVLKHQLDILYFNLFFLEQTLVTVNVPANLLAHKLCDHLSWARSKADSKRHEWESLYSYRAIRG